MDAQVEILEDDDATTVSFTAMDQDAQDAREVVAFKAALLTPGREDASPGLTVEPGSQGVTGTTVLFMAMILGVFCVAGFSRTPVLFALIPVIALIAALRQRRSSTAATKAPPPDARFTVTIGNQTLAIDKSHTAARSFPLARVVAFEAGRRVDVVMADGSRETMPFTLGSALTRGAEHASLVTTLNEHLARRRNARVGYRGATGAPEDTVVAQAEGEEAPTSSGAEARS